MSISLGNGKVIITDDAIKIKKGLLGRSEVIQKHLIVSINSVGGIFAGIINTIIIIGALRGIPFLMGKREVHIKTYDKEHVFWLSKSDSKKLEQNL